MTARARGAGRPSAVAIVAVIAVIAMVALAPPPAAAASVEWSGSLALASDYVFRGVSQTDEEPAIQGEVTASWDPGWYAGLWASNVEFGPGDDAQAEIDLVAGRAFELPQAWTLDVALTYYAYPNEGAYDYAEILAVAEWRERLLLQLAVSDDALAAGSAGADLAVGWRFALRNDWTIELLAGHSFIDALPHGGYSRAELGVSHAWGMLELGIAAHATSNAQDEFGSTADPRLVVSLTWSFPPPGPEPEPDASLPEATASPD